MNQGQRKNQETDPEGQGRGLKDQDPGQNEQVDLDGPDRDQDDGDQDEDPDVEDTNIKWILLKNRIIGWSWKTSNRSCHETWNIILCCLFYAGK